MSARLVPWTDAHVALTQVGDCCISTVRVYEGAHVYYQTDVLEPRERPTTALRFSGLGGSRSLLTFAIAHHGAVAARVAEEMSP